MAKCCYTETFEKCRTEDYVIGGLVSTASRSGEGNHALSRGANKSAGRATFHDRWPILPLM